MGQKKKKLVLWVLAIIISLFRNPPASFSLDSGEGFTKDSLMDFQAFTAWHSVSLQYAKENLISIFIRMNNATIRLTSHPT